MGIAVIWQRVEGALLLAAAVLLYLGGRPGPATGLRTWRPGLLPCRGRTWAGGRP